jgi:hypothetical protein
LKLTLLPRTASSYDVVARGRQRAGAVVWSEADGCWRASLFRGTYCAAGDTAAEAFRRALQEVVRVNPGDFASASVREPGPRARRSGVGERDRAAAHRLFRSL